MPDSKLLTVVVTSYNYEKYIRENLDSLLNQTHNNFNIIVIDDGSKDNSVEIIKSYLQKYENILFLQHGDGENKGLCKTMQVALSHVKTPYVAFCESDDYWEKNHVKNLIGFIQTTPKANMIFSRIEVKNYSDNPEYDGYVASTNLALKEMSGKNIFNLMTSNYMPTFSAACLKTELLRNCDFNSYYPQYLDFWLWRQLCVDNEIYLADDSITYWRKHNESYDMQEHIKDIKTFLIKSNNVILKKFSGKISILQSIKFYINSLLMSKNKYIKYQMKKILKYKMDRDN